MSFTTLLDVAIGLAVVYLSASLCVTVLNEYLAQALELRARQLKDGLKKLIDAPDVIAVLKQHPALAGFFTDGQHGSSYVEPRVLAQQVLGALQAGRDGTAKWTNAIAALPDGALKTNLQAVALTTKENADAFVEHLGSWFDKSLTMLGESYKRRAQETSFMLGLIVAAALNLDSIGIAHRLYVDRDARDAMASYGAEIVKLVPSGSVEACSKALASDRTPVSGDLKPPASGASVADSASSVPADRQPPVAATCEALKNLANALRHRSDTFGRLPIGWPAERSSSWLPVQLSAPIGWLITALAVSLGATFWFDLLSRVVNIRQGMRKPVPESAGDSAGT